MRRSDRTRVGGRGTATPGRSPFFGRPRTTVGLPILLLFLACGQSERVTVPDRPGSTKTAAAERAERRLFDGAPPVIPHENFGIACAECHDLEGMDVPAVGFAPPSPHEKTVGMSAISRCMQCHVFAGKAQPFADTTFVGLRQDLRRGARLNAAAPPTMPHGTFLRENCLACHSGPAAREEIRTDHPERERCRQCHVPVTERSTFP